MDKLTRPQFDTLKPLFSVKIILSAVIAQHSFCFSSESGRDVVARQFDNRHCDAVGTLSVEPLLGSTELAKRVPFFISVGAFHLRSASNQRVEGLAYLTAALVQQSRPFSVDGRRYRRLVEEGRKGSFKSYVSFSYSTHAALRWHNTAAA